jgi:uncharacterized protein HemX
MIDLIKGIFNLSQMSTAKLLVLTALLSIAAGMIYWAKAQYDQFIEDTKQNGYDQCLLDTTENSEASNKKTVEKLKVRYEKIIAEKEKEKKKANELVQALRAENQRLQELEDDIPEASNANSCSRLGDPWLRVFNDAIPVNP